MSQGDLAPTARLRWIDREVPASTASSLGSWGISRERVLQQFWAPDMPSYMRQSADGEWRDVPVMLP